MYKSDKRHLNIRNKLFAAIAMLLVSSIMMVSTTYAWFTLSTAPEVQGITTTVGANGALEIALSPASGAEDGITSDIGDATGTWAEKNVTWGNLLSMTEENGDDIYGLSEISLLPAQLNVSGNVNAGYTIQSDKILKIPTYGPDGRISILEAADIVTGTKSNASGTEGFVVNTTNAFNYGVRAIGTSSTMSPTALNYQNALGGINSSRIDAANALVSSIGENGNALASIAIVYAAEGESSNFAPYVDELHAMIADLKSASNYVGKALYNATLAILSSSQYGDAETYNTVKNAMDTGAGFETVWSNVPDALKVDGNPLNTAYNNWNTANTQIKTAEQNLPAVPSDENANIAWSSISTSMTSLMNTAGITINGKTVSEVKQNPFSILTGTNGINLQLGAGSGVYGTLATLVGDIATTVTLTEGSITYAGETMNLEGMIINIMTNAEPANGPYLTQVRSTIAGTLTAGGDGEASASFIDVTYGYAIDLMFRTNAADSSLLLQTEAAQRIYDDSNNAATMGHGSTMTFSANANNVESVAGAMEGIRIVFTDTVSSTMCGIAKMDPMSITVSYTYTPEATEENPNPTATTVANQALYTKTQKTDDSGNAVQDADGNPVYEIAVHQVPAKATGVTLSGKLYMYGISNIANDGSLTFEAEPMSVATITALSQNQVKRITAWVYLDGDYVDNGDVVNSSNGISMRGTMNLQFASSAELVPMENSDLRTGDTTETTTESTGA